MPRRSRPRRPHRRARDGGPDRDAISRAVRCPYCRADVVVNERAGTVDVLHESGCPRLDERAHRGVAIACLIVPTGGR